MRFCSVWRISSAGGNWESRANYPMAIRRHCGVADPGHDRLYILGGIDNNHNRAEVYYYQVDLLTQTEKD